LAEHLAELRPEEDAHQPWTRHQHHGETTARPGPMMLACESGRYPSGVDETSAWIGDNEYDI
jgi:hypothetical protein